MSFEELIKKYESSMAVPMYPKALVIDFMKKAYKAGLHADVHTDNSKVIAELENKIADIKANCDLAIEGRDIKIMELEQLLNEYVEDNTKVSSYITKLEQQIEKMKCCNNCKHSRTEYEHCRTNKHEKWEIKEND